MWMTRAGVQVFRSEFYTQIHLDYVKVEILFCIKKKKRQLDYGYNSNQAMSRELNENNQLMHPLSLSLSCNP